MRCMNCNKKIPGGIENAVVEKIDGLTCSFCSEDCKEDCGKFLNYARKYEKLFLALVIIPMIICTFASLILGEWVVCLMLVILGATLTLFPFCTPQTIQLIGVKKSVLIGRILGIALIGWGIFWWIR